LFRDAAFSPEEPFVNPDLTIGSAVTTVARSPFSEGGNSYNFTGATNSTNSYISTPGSDDWAFGTGDFTVEWFSYQTNLNNPQFQRIYTVRDYVGPPSPPSASISTGVSIEGGAFTYWRNGVFTQRSQASTVNVWIHWAVVRISGVTRLYRNGTQLGANISDTANITDATRTFVVGNTNTFASNAALRGDLTNFRLVKGLGVYTGAFTVPTSALTATANANPYGGSNTVALGEGFTKLLLVP
jgi:hypothetical protein